jgi:hypothetical protein
MPKSVQITAPWPTFEEMVEDLDIPADRRAELDDLALKIFQIEGDRKASSGAASAREEKPRNASAAD